MALKQSSNLPVNRSISTQEGRLVSFYGGTMADAMKYASIIANCWNINRLYGTDEDPCQALQIENEVFSI